MPTTNQNIRGWEDGRIDVGSARLIQDGTAHTGCYHIATLIKSGGESTTVAMAALLPVTTFAYACARVYFRIKTNVDVNGQHIASIENGINAGSPALTLRLNTDRTWSVNFSTGSTSGGSALALNTWYELTMEMSFTQSSGLGSGSVSINGQVLTVAGGGGGLANSGRHDRFLLGTNTAFNSGSASTVGEVEWDDAVIIITDVAPPALPTAKRIRAVPVIGQGVTAQWAGSYTTLQEIPSAPAGSGQTSAAAGLVTTLTHHNAAQLGIAAIQALKVYQSCVRPSSSSNEAVRVGATDFPVSVSTSISTTQYALDWHSWTVSEFNAAELGFVNVTGASLTLHALLGEVLYVPDGSDWFACQGTTANGAPPFATAFGGSIAPSGGISPTSGSILGGTLVTITGAGFDNRTIITFDGIPATKITVVSSTTVTCLTPPHPVATVDVAIVNGNIITGGFTYTTFAGYTFPHITSISPAIGPVTGGTSVTITGTNFTSGMMILFDGFPATDIIFVSSTTYTCKTPQHEVGLANVAIYQQ